MGPQPSEESALVNLRVPAKLRAEDDGSVNLDKRPRINRKQIHHLPAHVHPRLCSAQSCRRHVLLRHVQTYHFKASFRQPDRALAPTAAQIYYSPSRNSLPQTSEYIEAFARA